MKCASHPQTETNLRCGKCGKPICPKCMVQTAVGARCRECAGRYRLPTYRVSLVHYLKAVGAALVVAVVAGVIWSLINSFIPFFNLNLILAPASGYVIVEAMGRVVNRKRGRGLAAIAGIAVVLAYFVNILTFGTLPFGIFRIIIDLLALGLGIYVAVIRIR